MRDNTFFPDEFRMNGKQILCFEIAWLGIHEAIDFIIQSKADRT